MRLRVLVELLINDLLIAVAILTIAAGALDCLQTNCDHSSRSNEHAIWLAQLSQVVANQEH